MGHVYPSKPQWLCMLVKMTEALGAVRDWVLPTSVLREAKTGPPAECCPCAPPGHGWLLYLSLFGQYIRAFFSPSPCLLWNFIQETLPPHLWGMPLPQQVPLVAHVYHSRSHWLHLSTPAGPTGYIPTPAGPIGYTHLTQQVPLVTHTYPSRSYWLHTCPSRSRWLHKSTPAGPNGCTCLLQQVSHWLQAPLVANI